QFYLQFGLREDPGRHTNETNGYHKERPADATTADDITAWLLTAIYTLFDTYALTATLWQEWTTLRLITEAAERHGLHRQPPFKTIIRDWVAARPYNAPVGQPYAAQRLAAFEAFSARFYDKLPLSELGAIAEETQKLAAEEQPAYQQQMNLLAYLDPGKYMDERVQIPMWKAKVGLIWEGQIYLFDAIAKDKQGRPLAFTEKGDRWPLKIDNHGQPLDKRGKPLTAQGGWLLRKEPGSVQPTPVAYLAPPDPAALKAMVHGVIAGKSKKKPSDDMVDIRLVQSPRAEQERVRALLPKETQQELVELAQAPIIVNWDEQDRGLPVGEIRRNARRGIGDHPLTILRTGQTILFDQSHIFFDGIWGMAIAEVMTNQASSWVQHLTSIKTKKMSAPEPLQLRISPDFIDETNKLRAAENYAFYEVDAETSSVDMRLVQQARKFLKQRGIMLTINDMLVLSRVFHAANYEPNDFLMKEVRTLPEDLRKPVLKSLEDSGGYNPALLIPIDASFVQPKERIYPITFRNAIGGIFGAHQEAIAALQAHTDSPNDKSWERLDKARRSYFAYLNAFGEMLNAFKDVAMQGESLNISILKLIGNLPPSIQHTLAQIPQRFGPLNEVIKGEEVFSNVGRVAENSSLVRFLSAKDDGQAKRFVWGILTDDTDRMTVTLRDFRPHVPLLTRAGHHRLTQKLANDYVLTFVAEVNQLSLHLTDMALAEDEMRWG
ncbi:MAG: hypothetical protein ACFB51_11305, partial [Anaerolineae bacterium]